MKTETKKFEMTEIYVEDQNYGAVMDFIKVMRTQGYSAVNPTTHYGKNGKEEDKMWWSKLTKKTEIPSIIKQSR